MDWDSVPIWAILVGTIAIVTCAIEVGYRFGTISHRKSADVKEAPISAIVASVLALTAFMLAFAFNIASSLYDSRKELVRDEAFAIQNAYIRADFLPEADRAEAKSLLREYLDARLAVVLTGNQEQLVKVIADAPKIHAKLWDAAVSNARKDMNSDVAALYIESLNELMRLHALRVAIAVRSRIPGGVWVILYSLILLGMMGLGYQVGIAGSGRSIATPILSISFAIVIALIAALDHPGRGLIKVPQLPLIDLQKIIAAP